MMPISFAALISGMMTLISTAPNLVVNSELMRQGEDGFSFFTITPFGLTILFMGVIYMLFARRWLPDNKDQSGKKRRNPTFKDFIAKYQLEKREYRVKVLDGSPLLNMQINELNFGGESINLFGGGKKRWVQIGV